MISLALAIAAAIRLSRHWQVAGDRSFPILVFAAAGGIVLLAAWLDDALGIDAFYHGRSRNRDLGHAWCDRDHHDPRDRSSPLTMSRATTDSSPTPLRAKIGKVPRSDQPAFLFLEIDGLAGPILEKAMAQGYAPNMKQWIDSGAYQLTVWEPDLSCQTGASQAGILLGSNEGIPAFRWWDKRLQKMMVVSSMDSAKALEAELSQGKGLLQLDGASRFNVFSGGASDSIGTFSKLSRGAGSASYWAYFLNPFCFARLVSLFVQDVLREWWEEFQQGVQKVEPRLNRPWKYAFIRAGTTAAQIEVARFMVISDIFWGKPSAYYTLFAYDEVAHHTGIDRHYTFKVREEHRSRLRALPGARTASATTDASHRALRSRTEHGRHLSPAIWADARRPRQQPDSRRRECPCDSRDRRSEGAFQRVPDGSNAAAIRMRPGSALACSRTR